MRRKNYTYLVIISVISLLLAAGCNSGNKGKPTLIDDVESDNLSHGIGSFNQIYHLYPSPGEMLGIIDMAEMTYDGNLLNPVGLSDKYLGTKSKTYILGVYMTDLAYAALFGRHEATLDYLEVVRTLSEEVRINEAVDDEMIENAKNNVEYMDSLYTISNDAFMNILAFCERNERSNVVVMISAGAFTESLFLAINMIDDYGTADIMLQHLADQKYTIDNFMLFALGLESNDPGVESIIKDLEKIKDIYDGMTPGTGKVSVRTSSESDDKQPKKLVIGGSGAASQPSLSEDEFNALKDAIIELRNKIVGAI